jgi:hypothetical protein
LSTDEGRKKENAANLAKLARHHHPQQRRVSRLGRSARFRIGGDETLASHEKRPMLPKAGA